MLRKNAVTCRKASRSIEAIQRGDDTFRFACQALAASLFELTNADLSRPLRRLLLPLRLLLMLLRLLRRRLRRPRLRRTCSV